MDLGKCESVRRYKKINRIGEGTYGFVYRAIDRTTKKVVALKRIIMHNEQQDGFPLTSIREIVCLKQCNHPNIVGLYGIAVGDSRDAVFLVFEYCVHDLSSILHNVRNPFKESEIKNLMRQLLLALDYLHNRSIVHRDIKPSNILYSIDGVLKLADFGMARLLARPFQPNLTVNVVTLWYRSPELLLGSPKYSFSMDLWSAGCILGELVLTKPIFPGNDELDQILLVFGILGCPTARIWPDIEELPLIVNSQINLARYQAKYVYNSLSDVFPTLSEIGLDFLNDLFTYDPDRRINAKEALRHRYFRCSPHPADPGLMPTFPSLHGNISDFVDEESLKSESING